MSEEYQIKYKGRLQRAYSEPDYETAKIKLEEIITELKEVNRSAARSLEEGLEETLIIHRLGLVEEFGRTFTKTNRELKFSVKEIFGKSKEMDKFRYTEPVDASFVIENRKKNEKSK